MRWVRGEHYIKNPGAFVEFLGDSIIPQNRREQPSLFFRHRNKLANKPLDVGLESCPLNRKRSDSFAD